MNIAQYIIDIATQGDAQAVKKVEILQGAMDKADQSAERLSKRVKKGLGDAFRALPWL